MPPIINAQKISKSFGAQPLFDNVSFTVSEGERIGLVGPNGSGKSTLLRILAGTEEPDTGNVAIRKRLRLSYVEQNSQFEPGESVRSVIGRALDNSANTDSEHVAYFAEVLGRAGFEDLEAEAAALSGGWQKRLAIVEALVQAPDVLLLDEPTNHLDLAGIEWLEALLEEAAFACVVVSHDRYFLENVAGDMAELSRVYPDGCAAGSRQLQRVPGEKRRIPSCAVETPGGAGKSGSFRNRVVATRSQSPHSKIQGPH